MSSFAGVTIAGINSADGTEGLYSKELGIKYSDLDHIVVSRLFTIASFPGCMFVPLGMRLVIHLLVLIMHAPLNVCYPRLVSAGSL